MGNNHRLIEMKRGEVGSDIRDKEIVRMYE